MSQEQNPQSLPWLLEEAHLVLQPAALHGVFAFLCFLLRIPTFQVFIRLSMIITSILHFLFYLYLLHAIPLTNWVACPNIQREQEFVFCFLRQSINVTACQCANFRNRCQAIRTSSDILKANVKHMFVGFKRARTLREAWPSFGQKEGPCWPQRSQRHLSIGTRTCVRLIDWSIVFSLWYKFILHRYIHTLQVFSTR